MAGFDDEDYVVLEALPDNEVAANLAEELPTIYPVAERSTTMKVHDLYYINSALYEKLENNESVIVYDMFQDFVRSTETNSSTAFTLLCLMYGHAFYNSPNIPATAQEITSKAVTFSDEYHPLVMIVSDWLRLTTSDRSVVFGMVCADVLRPLVPEDLSTDWLQRVSSTLNIEAASFAGRPYPVECMLKHAGHVYPLQLCPRDEASHILYLTGYSENPSVRCVAALGAVIKTIDESLSIFTYEN